MFLLSLLKKSQSDVISTQDLLTVAESLGLQAFYKNSIHLRRRIFSSFDDFCGAVQLRRQREVTETALDPYGAFHGI